MKRDLKTISSGGIAVSRDIDTDNVAYSQVELVAKRQYSIVVDGAAFERVKAGLELIQVPFGDHSFAVGDILELRTAVTDKSSHAQAVVRQVTRISTGGSIPPRSCVLMLRNTEATKNSAAIPLGDPRLLTPYRLTIATNDTVAMRQTSEEAGAWVKLDDVRALWGQVRSRPRQVDLSEAKLAFEAAHLAGAPKLPLDESGNYLDFETQVRWEGWCAALELIANGGARNLFIVALEDGVSPDGTSSASRETPTTVDGVNVTVQGEGLN